MQNNKTILVVIHGRSIEELETRIDEFKNVKCTWASMSTFDIPQKYILDRIDKKFNVVFDSSTVKNEREYELEVRIPRLIKYLSENKENKYICTKTDKNNLFNLRSRLVLGFNENFKDQIIYTEDLGIDPNPFCVSLHLYIACLVKMGFSRIILFGADGGGKWGNSIESYYKWEEIKKDKEIAGNLSYNMVGDSNNINSSFEPLMKQSLGFVPEIINCSPGSVYSAFKNISYSEVLNYIGG